MWQCGRRICIKRDKEKREGEGKREERNKRVAVGCEYQLSYERLCLL